MLAGGTGSRLWPLTSGISKQLLPVYDKPLIYYPISTLMMAGIRDIIIITTPNDQQAFMRILGDGSFIGVSFTYRVQSNPVGLADAFLIAEEDIRNQKTALILGDNIFHGTGLGSRLSRFNNLSGAQIFGYRVSDPQRYGIVELGNDNKVISIQEKPKNPRSSIAIPGLYFYDEKVSELAKQVVPSERGELEITSLNEKYHELGELSVEVLPRGTAWLDTGTFNSLHDASSYVRTLEERQGSKIACLEEVSFRNGWIDSEQLLELASKYRGNEFGVYLLNLTKEVV